MPNRAAGDLPEEEDQDLKGRITFKKGTPFTTCRGGESFDFTFEPFDGYDFLHLKANTLASRREGTNPPLAPDFKIYFKRFKNATQSQYVEITAENFLEQLRYRWHRITALDMQHYATANTTAIEGTIFEFIVYVPKRNPPQVQRLRRATAPAIRRERERLRQHAAINNLQIGPIAEQHLATYNARAPEGTELTIPTDATTRQAQALDRDRAQLQNEDAQALAERNSVFRPVEIELFGGTKATIRINIASLRQALSLPNHDLFHQGIYNGYTHPELPEGADMEDVDHQNQAD